MNWRAVAAVAAGGVLGALSRYGLGVGFPTSPSAFPWTTFAINIAGCLLIGVLVPLVGDHPIARPFLGAGFLGGFTTFSTYIIDIHRLVRLDRPAAAVAYLAATVITAVLAAFVGGVIGERLTRVPA